MKTTALLAAITVVAVAGPAVAEDLDTLYVLDERANRPAEPWLAREDLEDVEVPTLLFVMTAPDNVVCIRGVDDVNGDGKAEVVVSSWENAVSVLSGFDGSQVWKTWVGSLSGGDVWTARAIDAWSLVVP